MNKDNLRPVSSIRHDDKRAAIYFDPPYGIKYGGNWQMRINSTNVKESDDGVTAEPEMIKAYRDTWEMGIHSYLSYLRDRLVMARELLTLAGGRSVQICYGRMKSSCMKLTVTYDIKMPKTYTF